MLEMDAIYSSGIVLGLVLGIIGADNSTICKSTQYLEIGTNGTVVCSFTSGFTSVFWYDSKNYLTDSVIIEYKNSLKNGKGYDSGEFDIHQNGSLIIQNVSLTHNHYFTVVVVRSAHDYNRHYVRVVAAVKPLHFCPVIENCTNCRALCFIQVPHGKELNCYVRDSRPGFTLQWINRTSNGDKRVSYEFHMSARGFLKTSMATTHDLLQHSSGLHLLVCKADGPTELLLTDESLVLVESDNRKSSSFKPISKYVKINSELNLPCFETDMTMFVWKYKHHSDKAFQEIAFGVQRNNKTTKVVSEGYILSNISLMLIPEVTFENEGYYVCAASNEIDETTVVYDITVYVFPVPAYLIVEGCNPNQYCVLEIERIGTLTCTARGIRPKVKLTWRNVFDSSSNKILFRSQQTTFITKEDGTFDVLHTVEYDASRVFHQKLTIECKVSAKEEKVFPLATKLDVLFVKGADMKTDHESVSKETEGKRNVTFWVITAFSGVVVMLTTLFVISRVEGRRKASIVSQMREPKDVMVPLFPVEDKKEKRGNEEFIKELKTKYLDLTAAVHPISYRRETKYSVSDVFIDVGFEFLVSGDKWEALDSYDKIFSDPRLTSSRYIIEGDAGYGKSMLCLQFAYDWCNSINASPLTQKDILILLQLRQLGGMKSISEAIKHCLLPKDTRFTNFDIENMLRESESVLVVLDGYDEYPDQDRGSESFVMNMINIEVMQKYEVVTTTRSACLPKRYAEQTKRIRLKGFDDMARELYLRKVLAGCKDVGLVKDKLNENLFLEDVFQIPLFYVLFAHLCKDKAVGFNFNSLTVFFRHIISCLHNHARNKIMNPDEEAKFQSYERDHYKLDDLAFYSLNRESPQLKWDKDFVCKRLGEEFYNHYVSIGVLVEETVCHIHDNPNEFNPQHIQHRQEVMFYHQLFLEWYAAHVVAKLAAEPGVNLDPRDDDEETYISRNSFELTASLQTEKTDGKQHNILEYLYPADFHFLFRFACGINPDSAEKIYQFLKTKCGGERFAILCRLEETGKLQNIKQRVANLCSKKLMFHSDHSKLLHLSTIQVLEIASMQQIPIVHIWLCNCFNKVIDSSHTLLLKSGIKIKQMHTVLALDVRENSRVMTEKETVEIINYCIGCRDLSILNFRYCLMPPSIPIKQMKTFQGNELSVVWYTGFATSFDMNLKYGLWQHRDGSGHVTDEQYEQEAKIFRKLRRHVKGDNTS